MPENRAQLLTYADIAEILGVKVETVRIYATSKSESNGDPDFPKPVSPPGARSPLFDPDDVERYRVIRASRRRGRPPRNREQP